MRSSSIVVLTVASSVLALVGNTAGCAVDSTSSSGFGRSYAAGPDPYDKVGPTDPSIEDASASGMASPLPYRGNPLCGIAVAQDGGIGTCVPDDTSRATSGALVCSAAPNADGGADGGGDTGPTSACRLLPSGPECVESSRPGTDGEACQTDADCAPGFDCVAGDKGSTCHHYCCMGDCSGQSSLSGGPTFCDIQQLATSGLKVPVCMPLKRCKLLTPGECAANESCAIVTEAGDTGCVGVGSAQVGQACDEVHCATGLTCLGSAGYRTCFQLCEIGKTSCGMNQTCKTSAVFANPTFGACQRL